MEKIDELRSGVKSALPIILGYLPIGITYGILASNSGLNSLETLSMSIFVFAGSAQLIAVEMLTASAGPLAIVIMTFLVNLRHLLMSASLSLHFKKSNKKLLPLLGLIITDESFAVGIASISDHRYKEYFYLGLGFAAYSGWVVSSWIGVALGGILPVAGLAFLDFVLPAMFIVLLVMQINIGLDLVVALLAALFSLIFMQILPDNWNIILATISAATCGVFFEKIIKTEGKVDHG